MYILETEQSFDSAHFLSGYEGKCSNLHGHRWRVVARIAMDELKKARPEIWSLISEISRTLLKSLLML